MSVEMLYNLIYSIISLLYYTVKILLKDEPPTFINCPIIF